MLELDDEILIIELQSTKVKLRYHKRFHVYLAIKDYNNVNLIKKLIYVFLQLRRNQNR